MPGDQKVTALFTVFFAISDLEMGMGRATFYPIHLVIAVALIVLTSYLFSRRRRCEPARNHEGERPDADLGGDNAGAGHQINGQDDDTISQ